MTDMAVSRRTGWVADDSTFGARLALVRQRMSWGNVKEAAEACGLPPESWRRWERDGRAPRNIVEITALIADKTGCDYFWLLVGPKGSTNGPSATLPDRTRIVRPVSVPPGRVARDSTRRPARIGRRLAA